MNRELAARVGYAAERGLSVAEEDLTELGTKGRGTLQFNRREILREKQRTERADAESFREQVECAEFYEAQFDVKYWTTHFVNLPYAKALLGVWAVTSAASYLWGFLGCIVGGAVSCSSALGWVQRKRAHAAGMLQRAEAVLRQQQGRTSLLNSLAENRK